MIERPFGNVKEIDGNDVALDDDDADDGDGDDDGDNDNDDPNHLPGDVGNFCDVNLSGALHGSD